MKKSLCPLDGKSERDRYCRRGVDCPFQALCRLREREEACLVDEARLPQEERALLDRRAAAAVEGWSSE